MDFLRWMNVLALIQKIVFGLSRENVHRFGAFLSIIIVNISFFLDVA